MEFDLLSFLLNVLRSLVWSAVDCLKPCKLLFVNSCIKIHVYRKIPRDLAEASLFGAGLSIIAALSMVFLFGMVCWSFLFRWFLWVLTYRLEYKRICCFTNLPILLGWFFLIWSYYCVIFHFCTVLVIFLFCFYDQDFIYDYLFVIL